MSQQIGFFREITPCPSSGKITFKQIGAIRQITTNIACDNEELLLARKPQPTGELDSFENPIYALKEPTYDPSDFYSAYWGASYDVIKGDDLGPTPLGDWNEQFEDPQPPDDFSDGDPADYVNGSRSVLSGSDADGSPLIRVYSHLAARMTLPIGRERTLFIDGIITPVLPMLFHTFQGQRQATGWFFTLSGSQPETLGMTLAAQCESLAGEMAGWAMIQKNIHLWTTTAIFGRARL